MTIGLISEPKSYTRKLLIKRFLKINVSDNITGTLNPFDMYAEVLPFSNRYLESMSANRLNKLINKKIHRLEKYGITKFILSDYLYKLCQAKDITTSSFANRCGKKLFLAISPLCIRQTAKNHSINLLRSSVCISDTKMDRISQYLLRELCFDTKKLILRTNNTDAAKNFCERFYDETGLWVEVSSVLNLNTDILIDVDNCEIKIGRDLFIRDARFDFDLCGYSVCHTDIASLLATPDLSHIQWVCGYEKLNHQ